MKRLLVANRGEIAVRIIRTAQEMGIETVLAVSEADTSSVAADLADSLASLALEAYSHRRDPQKVGDRCLHFSSVRLQLRSLDLDHNIDIHR